LHFDFDGKIARSVCTVKIRRNPKDWNIHEPYKGTFALLHRATNYEAKEGTNMRKLIMGAASALALASPAAAADLPVTPYSSGPSYERETHSYEYRTAPPVVVAEPAPVASETVIVRRPVIVAPPEWWLRNIPSMRHRGCMRHLTCLRTPARVGVIDGDTAGIFTAVGSSEVIGTRCREPWELLSFPDLKHCARMSARSDGTVSVQAARAETVLFLRLYSDGCLVAFAPSRKQPATSGAPMMNIRIGAFSFAIAHYSKALDLFG
jgi:hypothetical protein